MGVVQTTSTASPAPRVPSTTRTSSASSTHCSGACCSIAGSNAPTLCSSESHSSRGRAANSGDSGGRTVAQRAILLTCARSVGISTGASGHVSPRACLSTFHVRVNSLRSLSRRVSRSEARRSCTARSTRELPTNSANTTTTTAPAKRNVRRSPPSRSDKPTSFRGVDYTGDRSDGSWPMPRSVCRLCSCSIHTSELGCKYLRSAHDEDTSISRDVP